jgi:ferredoxin
MKVQLDRDRCIGASLCVLAAPEVFDQDDEGVALLLDDNPADDARPAVLDAAQRCPAAVITIVPDGTPGDA